MGGLDDIQIALKPLKISETTEEKSFSLLNPIAILYLADEYI